MKKIVLISRDRANREWLITMMESLFPECPVEVIARKGPDPVWTSDPVDKETDITEKKVAFIGN